VRNLVTASYVTVFLVALLTYTQENWWILLAIAISSVVLAAQSFKTALTKNTAITALWFWMSMFGAALGFVAGYMINDLERPYFLPLALIGFSVIGASSALRDLELSKLSGYKEPV
jgi:peptidoglycan/LPS O-acetylase OafA/YrhL